MLVWVLFKILKIKSIGKELPLHKVRKYKPSYSFMRQWFPIMRHTVEISAN
jgi:hypothetical protein